MGNSVSEQPEKKIDGWRHTLSSYFSLALMLITAFIAVITISEIAARESVSSMLTGQITALKSEFLEQNRYKDGNVESPDKKSVDQSYQDRRRQQLLDEIEQYEQLKRALNTLIALGSEVSFFSLRAVQYRILSVNQPDEGSYLEYIKKMKDEDWKHSPIAAFLSESSASLLLRSSDQLLVLAVMSCAAIGAMIAALRGNSLMTLRALSLGIATGFVVYLAIKGGKHVFLMQMQGEIVPLNPYGCAFAGLIAGLFTEKAYQILTTIVDDFTDRLRAASAGKKSD